MAIFLRKDLQSENFYECNQALAKQVTEVCDSKQAVFSAKMKENNSEFPDALIYDTYSTIQDMFQSMYNANVEDEIYLGKKKGSLYLDDQAYCADLEAVMKNMTNYIKDLVYEFGSLTNAGSGNVTVADSFATYLLRQRLSREEYEEYKALTSKALKGAPVLFLTEDEKKRFIELYEKLYPSDADNMESLVRIFEKEGYAGYEEDLMNVKVLAYTADEPYKSVYINNISKVQEGKLDCPGRAHVINGVFYVNLVGVTDKKTSSTYSAFFHETSHCIDYYLGEGEAFTISYRDGNKSLCNVLEADVRKRIHNTVDDYFKSNPDYTMRQQEAIRAYVEDAIMNQVDYPSYGDPDFAMIVGSDPLVNKNNVDVCYRYVIKNIKIRVLGFADDIYGGLTGNTLSNKTLHHEAIVKNGQTSNEYRLYWISGGINSDGSGLYITLENGERYDETIDFTDSTQWEYSDLDERVIMSEANVVYKNSIASEFFADSMASNLCRDSRNSKVYEFYDEDTIDYFEKMLETMY